MNGSVILWPVSFQSCPVTGTGIGVSNPVMQYSFASGVPTSVNPPPAGYQFIVPPFTNLPALMYEATSSGPAFTWNVTTGNWQAL